MTSEGYPRSQDTNENPTFDVGVGEINDSRVAE